MKKKFLLCAGIVVLVAVIILGVWRYIEARNRQTDPNRKFAEQIYKMENALKELDDDYECKSISKVTPYAYADLFGNTITYSIFTDMKLGERFRTFMHKIRESDFTLMICTPEYQRRADFGIGGLAEEWNIVTSSVVSSTDERKFIPVLFSGDWQTSLPMWALGKMGIDYRNESQTEFEKLITTFEEYESQKLCEVLDCDGVIRSQNTEDKPFKERGMLKITNQWGEDEVVEVIAYFTLNSTGEDYIVYTKNETDENGNVEVLSSKVVHEDEYNTSFVGVSEKEWEEIKQVMLEMANED